jgi:hypothetical protein
MRSFIEKIVDSIIAKRKKLLKTLASEAYAQQLRVRQKPR